ncbi:cohesin domain-containing protein, partial [Patescibacteria group bacterium]|nr:cohesin domain-containing protein [Patescibacteria group bacterium]
MWKIHEKSLILTRITTKVLVSLGLIFVFFSVSGASNAAHAASLYFSPSSGSHAVGSTFSVSVLTSSANQAMNAVSGVISFPANKLEIVSLSKSGSIISLWVQEPSFSNVTGTINFEGIVLNPGFIGASGKIITINFKAKAAGSAALSFSSGSILANDGKGTNILEGLGSASFSITASASSSGAPPAEKNISPSVLPNSKVPSLPEIHSSTHPSQEKWYQNSNPEFSWKITPDILGVSLYLNDRPASNPGPASDGIFGVKTYENLADGVWYLHLKLKKGHTQFNTSLKTYPYSFDTLNRKNFLSVTPLTTALNPLSFALNDSAEA